VPKNKRQGWEDQLQHQFESMAKEEFGIELDDTVFLG
jgi:aarF domain-containing kinase